MPPDRIFVPGVVLSEHRAVTLEISCLVTVVTNDWFHCSGDNTPSIPILRLLCTRQVAYVQVPHCLLELGDVKGRMSMHHYLDALVLEAKIVGRGCT